MDPLTHLLLTRRLVGSEPAVVTAGLAPDAPFYLTYPAWVIRQGVLAHALRTNEWPDPPRWIVVPHRATHSVIVVCLATLLVRAATGRWPMRVLQSWLLHILIDMPTHARHPWGPQVLWPLSSFAVDGVLWTDGVAWSIGALRRRRARR